MNNASDCWSQILVEPHKRITPSISTLNTIKYLVKCLVHKHASIHDCLTVRWRLGQFVVDDGHVVWHLVVGFLKIHLAGKLLSHLVQGLRGPVSKPIQHTPINKDVSC